MTKYFKVKIENKNYEIKRKQFPLVPAIASTCYKIQGKTFTKLIVDLSKLDNKNINSFYIYVSLSRLTSWEGLNILRDFDESIFSLKPSEVLIKEIERLKAIEIKTLHEFSKLI